MGIDTVQLSRTMAYALRHHPDKLGVTLDAEGWVPVDALLQALRQHRPEWQTLAVADLEDVIATSEKKRYELVGDRIRAHYGHSVREKVQHQLTQPPAILFHGTTPQARDKIRRSGLKPMGRQYVHLSDEEQTARTVALRRTHAPVILHIQAEQAFQAGIAFYITTDRVWLADAIPPAYIIFD